MSEGRNCFMEKIRQAINQVLSEITVDRNWNNRDELKKNSFIVICNKDNQINELDTLLKSELVRKLHGSTLFEIESLSGNVNREDVEALFRKMAESRMQKFSNGLPRMESLSLELVIAGEQCLTETVKIIHDAARNILERDSGFQVTLVDYLLFDFSNQKVSGTISPQYLQKLEEFYQEEGILPYICTEELLVSEQYRHQKAIKTVAALIVMHMFGNIEDDSDVVSGATWRCAAYKEVDKLLDYIVNLFYRFMSEQDEIKASENTYSSMIETFLKKDIVIDLVQVVEDMKKMPMAPDSILPDCRNKLFFSFFRTKKLLERRKLIQILYGSDNPIRAFVDLNYRNMHMAEIEDVLWQEFQMQELGTRKDVQKYLENVLYFMCKEKEKKIQEKKAEVKRKEDTRVTLDNHMGAKSGECVEKLLDELVSVFQSMAELESAEREAIALKALYDKVSSEEFHQKLQRFEKNQNQVIGYLRNINNRTELDIHTGANNLIEELIKIPGYWKREYVEDDIVKEIVRYLNSRMEQIWEDQRENAEEIFFQFSEEVWREKNMPADNHVIDFWAVRKDRLQISLDDKSYIFVNRGFFCDENQKKRVCTIQNLHDAQLIETSRQSSFSLEYMNIRNMEHMELLAAKMIDGE